MDFKEWSAVNNPENYGELDAEWVWMEAQRNAVPAPIKELPRYGCFGGDGMREIRDGEWIKRDDAIAATAPIASSAALTVTDLHAAIMNIRCVEPAEYQDPAVRMAYRIGHRDARHTAAELAAQPAEPASIESMVDRFLGWKLPHDFAPDCGISFAPVRHYSGEIVSWPIGTNLLNADQAQQMFEYVLAAQHAEPTVIDGCTEENCVRCKTLPEFRTPDMRHAGIGSYPSDAEPAPPSSKSGTSNTAAGRG